MKSSGLQGPKKSAFGFGSHSSRGNLKKSPFVIGLTSPTRNSHKQTMQDWLLEMFEPEFNYIDTTESEARPVVKAKKLEDFGVESSPDVNH